MGASSTQVAADPEIDVCVCTYKRESIVETIRSIGQQSVLKEGLRLRIIVADNDSEPSAAKRVQQAARAANLDLVYLHAPARNISIARNACLAAAVAPWIAFIDDDEIATSDWLASLVSEARKSGASIVLGPVVAQYAEGVPPWIVSADTHSTAPAIRRDGEIDTGYSCNVLLKRDIIGELTFDLKLGRTGGEDDVFFSRLYQAGHAIAFAPEAVVNEDVPLGRANLKWLLRRSFRNGQTFASIRNRDGMGRARLLAISSAKLAYCVGVSALSVGNPKALKRSLVRGALHGGAIGFVFGKRGLELY